MNHGSTRLHIVSERDVGLFSLIQQVAANIPWALAENRVPVVRFGNGTCYWTPNGYRGRRTVWEYYFEPLNARYPVSTIPERTQALISVEPPSPHKPGYHIDKRTFVSSHFGDHPQLNGTALRIPYGWDDPSDSLRWEAKAILDSFVRPRGYIRQKVSNFFLRHMAGHYVIGVHARGTDATSSHEVRSFRQGSLALSKYLAEIERILEIQPRARILVASDEQSSLSHIAKAFPHQVIAYDSVRHTDGEGAGKGPTGWIMPAYITGSRDVAAKNGEDAVIEYLLLSRCDYLIHNGSSLARTALLKSPLLPHTNTHRKPYALTPSGR